MGPQWKKGRRIIEVEDRSKGKSSAGPRTSGEWGSFGLKLDDFPGFEVRALVGGGALHDGRG